MPEDNDVKDYTQSPTEKKKVIEIPIEVKLGGYQTPSCLESWSKEDSYTPEFEHMMDEFGSIVDYVCKQLNEGPEVKDNITKRILTLRIIIKALLGKTFINNLSRVGMLEQLLFDIMYEQQMREALTMYKKQQEQAQKEENERMKNYVG
jgi:hypothetical protein